MGDVGALAPAIFGKFQGIVGWSNGKVTELVHKKWCMRKIQAHTVPNN